MAKLLLTWREIYFFNCIVYDNIGNNYLKEDKKLKNSTEF